MKTLKLAVVGCGGIGQAHIRNAASLEGAKVAYCVDLNMERAAKAAELCKGTALDSLDKIPSDTDGVIVAAQPLAHYPIVKNLLEKNFNVFCEKPLTMKTSECRELGVLAERKGRVLMTGFKMRFEPVFRKAKELLPMIGELVMLSSVKQQPYSERPEYNWFPKVGAMFELSVHDFDLIHWIAGIAPEKVLYANLSHRFGWERDDAFALTVRYNNGVTGQLSGMYAKESSFMFKDITMMFLGEKGYMRVERPDRIIIHDTETRVFEVDSSNANAFLEEQKHYCAVLRGEEENTLGAEAAANATFIADEAFKISNMEK